MPNISAEHISVVSDGAIIGRVLGRDRANLYAAAGDLPASTRCWVG